MSDPAGWVKAPHDSMARRLAGSFPAPYEGVVKTYRWTIVTAALGVLILLGALALLLR